MAIADIDRTLNPVQGQAGAGNDQNRRGYNVYTLSQLMSITGKTKDGDIITGSYDQSVFYLNYDERIQIYRLCAPVNAVVTNRMNVISSMNFEVVPDKRDEDRIAEQLKNYRDFSKEIEGSPDIKYIIARGAMQKEINETLPDCLPDLSNFDRSLLRWKKRIQSQHVEDATWIKEWIIQPNVNDRYEEFIKKIVCDLMIHGNFAVYKEVLNGRIENIYPLPGGTVIPLKNKYVGGACAYVQVTNRMDEPQIYFSDEVSYANYMPMTARAYGFIPLEALINKIAETLLFDRLMADQADGTKPPEKMVIITENSPFGDLNKEFNVPLDPDEQQRIEQKINTPKKHSIMTFSGNNAQIVDLSRENTMAIQMQRQKDIREEVGMVFQATPMEMNLSGSDNVSGRSTADAQREIYQSKGINPIIKIIEMVYNRDILPFRVGPGWKIEYDTGKNELEDLEILQRKVNTGLWSINQLRTEELNEQPFPGEEEVMEIELPRTRSSEIIPLEENLETDLISFFQILERDIQETIETHKDKSVEDIIHEVTKLFE